MSIDVALFVRAPRELDYSIENAFEVVRDHLPEPIAPRWQVSPFPTTGIVPRIRSLAWARRRQARVNHVTGDVNFLALSLDPERTVLTIHDLEFLERHGGLKAAIFGEVWLRRPFRRARVVTVPTAAVQHELAAFVGAAPSTIRVVPNPVHPRFSPTMLRPLPAEPVVLHVGTRSNKNLEGAIGALVGTPCRLVVIGRMSPGAARARPGLGRRGRGTHGADRRGGGGGLRGVRPRRLLLHEGGLRAAGRGGAGLGQAGGDRRPRSPARGRRARGARR